MKTRIETAPNGAEIGIITHEGRDFAAFGSFVSDDRAVAYCGPGGILQSWGGNQIGTWRAVASWRLPLNCWISDRMYQIEAVINGKTYTGRGCGEGMIWKGKIKKGGRRS